MVLNLRDKQHTPTAPGLGSQRVEEDGEHDFNILGNGQKEDLEEKPHGASPSGSGARGKRWRAEYCRGADAPARWQTPKLCVDYIDRN